MRVVLLFALATLIPIVPVLIWLGRRGAHATEEEVASSLEAFLNGTGSAYDWDDFISVSLRDPVLEAVRLRCAGLPEEFPPQHLGHYCSEAGLEVTLVDAVAAWRDVYESLLRLWLDSREYEGLAHTQLLAPSSPINARGLALAERLSTSVPVYYWWFGEGLSSTCPRCSGPVAPEGRHLVCVRCHIIVEPAESAG